MVLKMIRLRKRNGNVIENKRFENVDDFKNNKSCSCGFEYIREINFSKSYVKELYCKQICGNCYNFGCDWDIRCNKNNKPINQTVSDCEKFHNAKKKYDEIIKRILNDDDFYNFCKFYNTKKKKGKYGNTESKFEIFLGIFNENRFSENRNELKFKNR